MYMISYLANLKSEYHLEVRGDGEIILKLILDIQTVYMWNTFNCFKDGTQQ
jgi:hypothetical protein